MKFLDSVRSNLPVQMSNLGWSGGIQHGHGLVFESVESDARSSWSRKWLST
jgi:hypothetical protein